ncbi:hypothetical protein, partial [Maricaulis sp.]|uniref:hypothetical protein n=1 Tax=Maricaulis sp. TaxID=1486257 RepID=UPI003A905D18
MIEIMGALGLLEWLGLARVSAVVLGAFRFRARPRRGDAAAAAAAPPPVVARQGGDGSVVLRIVHHLPYEYVDE